MKILGLCPFPGSVLANTIAKDGTPGQPNVIQLRPSNRGFENNCESPAHGEFFQEKQKPSLCNLQAF